MRFKSILGAFIFIVAASLAAMIIFVQTKSFGRVASKVISDISLKKAQAKVSIKSLGISLFPPGLELHQVKISKSLGEGKKFKGEFGKLGIYLGLIELEDRSVTLGEIRITDSTIDYTAPEDKEKPIEEIDQELINKVFKISDGLPFRVDTLLLENSKVFVNHDLSKREDSFLARFHLANIKPVKEKSLTIDEIWGDANISRKDVTIQRLKIQHDVHTLLMKGKISNYRLLKKADVSLAGEASIHIQNLKDDLALPESVKLLKGFAHVSFKASQLQQRPHHYAVSLHMFDLPRLLSATFILNL